MVSKVAVNEWSEILHHETDRLLELRWLPGEMSDAAFQASLALLALEAEKARPSRVLIDATQFHHRPGEGVMEWRNIAIIPRYGAAGVRRFALLAPPGFPNTVEQGHAPEVDGPAVFPTAWFAERANAMVWLKQA
jgi:hypothetical protein